MKFTIVAILAIAAIIPSSLAGPKGYQESCSSRKAMENCRVDLDLICEDGACVCKEMAYWDEEIGACIALIGETCTAPESYFYFFGSAYNSAITRCPTDAVCTRNNPNKAGTTLPGRINSYYSNYYFGSNGDNKCYCKAGFYADEDKSECIKALKGGEKCVGDDVTAKCDKAAGLICDKEDKVCSCKKSDDIFYHEEEQKCLTKIGRNCTKSTYCDKNSICSTSLNTLRNRYNWGSDNDVFEGINGQCTCIPGYTLNSQGHCVGSHSVACSTENPCNTDTFLECIDGLCQCQAGSHQIFAGQENSQHNGIVNGTCQLLVHSTCKADGTGPQCTENSKCIDGACKCDDGFSQSPSGKCLESYQAECTSRNLTSTDFFYRHAAYATENATCNFYQGLACFNNKCVCFDNALNWDEGKRLCVAAKNEQCGPIMMSRGYDGDFEPFYPKAYLHRQGYSLHSYYVACAGDMRCQKEYNGIEGWNVCVDKADYKHVHGSAPSFVA